MSDWTRIADDAIEATFGPGGRLHLLYPDGNQGDSRCVAWVEDGFNEDGLRHVIAIAAGANHGEACRLLVQMCYRDDHRPTTSETAAVLGVSDSRIRQLVMTGKLAPAQEGDQRHPARFNAADVWEFVKQEART